MRVTNGPASRKRRKRMITAAKGFRLRRSKLYRYASDAVDHGRQYAYRDRRNKKRTFRYLWQVRINIAARAAGITYSRFIEGLKAAQVEIDRKVLADLAATDTDAFTEIGEGRAGRPQIQGLSQGLKQGTQRISADGRPGDGPPVHFSYWIPSPLSCLLQSMSLLDQIEPLKQSALAELNAAADMAALEAAKGAWIGPHGKFTGLMKQLGTLPKEEKPAAGKAINAAEA